MKRAVVAIAAALACLPRVAGAESPAERLAAELRSEDAVARAGAFQALRRLGPQAAEAVRAAARDATGETAALAALLPLCWEWDPLAGLDDPAGLLPLVSEDPEERFRGWQAILRLGFQRAQHPVRRALETAEPSARARFLNDFTADVNADPSWSPVLRPWLSDAVPAVRRAAANALTIHGLSSDAGTLRAALSAEKDPAVRRDFWIALARLAESPDQLPPLPEDAPLRTEILRSMTSSDRPGAWRFAWNEFARSRPAAIPHELLARPHLAARRLGLRSVERQIWLDPAPDTDSWSPEDLDALASSPFPTSRAQTMGAPSNSPRALWRTAALLDDPDPGLRDLALEVLTSDLELFDADPVPEQRRKYRTLGLAVRGLLDAAAGAATPEEARWCVRQVLDAGKDSYEFCRVAMQSLALSGEPGRAAMRDLAEDDAVGPAAKNVLRALSLGVPPPSFYFEEGLSSVPYLDSFDPERFDVDGWRRLVASEDVDDRRLAARAIDLAWDDVYRADDVRDAIRKLLPDEDGDVKEIVEEAAVRLLPEEAPEKDRLDWYDAAYRSRAYVLKRLRAAVAAPEMLPQDQVSLIPTYGDRGLVLSAARSPHRLLLKYPHAFNNAAEPGLLPLWMGLLGDIERPPWETILPAIGATGAQGARMLAAFARGAAIRPRAIATGLLLGGGWEPAVAEESLVAICSRTEPDGAEMLRLALAYSNLRGAPGERISPRTVEALASAVVRIADHPEQKSEIHAIVSAAGTALRRAPEAVLREMLSRRSVLDAAIHSRIPLGPRPEIVSRILCGNGYERSAALGCVGQGKGPGLWYGVHAWLRACPRDRRHLAEQVGWGSADAAPFVLLLASGDEANREDLLRLHSILRTQARRPQPAPAAAGSLRFADAPIPAAFEGRSREKRGEVVSGLQDSADSGLFSGLCAAAFRGDRGDDIALAGVSPFLGPEALPRLGPLLFRRDSAVRAEAALAVGRAGKDAPAFALALLRAAAPRETEKVPAAMISAALARLGDPEALRRLEAAADSQEPDARLEVVDTLSVVPIRAAALLLARLAGDSDFRVRWLARIALADMCDRKADGPDHPGDGGEGWRRWLEANPDAVFKDARQRTFESRYHDFRW